MQANRAEVAMVPSPSPPIPEETAAVSRGRIYIGPVKRETIQRIATPTGILVGLGEELAALCTEVLGDGGLRVLRAAHVVAASERIPVVMPQLVVVSAALRQEELDLLNDRCVAVGAEVIRVAPDGDRRALVSLLKDSATNALIKALRGG
jgi:hypothetical protein